MKNTRKNKGITLVALVITIIILLILAGISISALTNTGIFKKSKDAKQKYENAELDQNTKLDEYETKIDEYLPSEGINAEQIANSTNKKEYYGKEVKGYTPKNGATTDWKILYADTNNIYLISADYIERKYLPTSTNLDGEETTNKPNDGDSEQYPRASYFTNVLNDYTGSDSIVDTVKNLNKSFFSQNFSSTNNSMKAVAYMLDIKSWNNFTDISGKADYAIGGPTIEILMESYSQKYDVQYKARAIKYENTENIGYQITKGNSWAESYSDMFDTNDSLYVINEQTNAPGMWVASPSANNTNDLMYVYYFGAVTNYDYGFKSYGFRPVVCLKSNVKLEKTGDSFIIK